MVLKKVKFKSNSIIQNRLIKINLHSPIYYYLVISLVNMGFLTHPQAKN